MEKVVKDDYENKYKKDKTQPKLVFGFPGKQNCRIATSLAHRAISADALSPSRLD